MAVVLRDPYYCGYPPEQVTLLSDAAANREGILAALNELAARVGEDDTCFIVVTTIYTGVSNDTGRSAVHE